MRNLPLESKEYDQEYERRDVYIIHNLTWLENIHSLK